MTIALCRLNLETSSSDLSHTHSMPPTYPSKSFRTGRINEYKVADGKEVERNIHTLLTGNDLLVISYLFDGG